MGAYLGVSVDELRLNKLFAAFLAALLLMAGIKIADIMVPHQNLPKIHM